MQSYSPIIDSPDVDMGQKQISELLEKLTGRVTALENTRGQIKAPKWDRGSVMALISLLVTVIGLPIMFLAWIQPHLETDLKNNITIEIQNQLKDPLKQLNEISGDLKEVKGRLEILNPLIQELVLKKMKAGATLAPRDLGKLAEIAKKDNIKIDPKDVAENGRRLAANGHDPEAWAAAISFLEYKSFLNGTSLLVPRAPPKPATVITKYQTFNAPGYPSVTVGVIGIVPKSRSAKLDLIGNDMNADASEGNEFIVVAGGGIKVNGMEIKNVIFRNVHILYTGGPLILDNVFFVDCTFDLPRQGDSQKFAIALLASTPAITLKIS